MTDNNSYSGLIILRVFLEVPLFMAATASVMGWSRWRDLRLAERSIPATEFQPDVIEPQRDGSQLRLIPADASVALGPLADQVLKDVLGVTTRVRFAYLVAALAYAALSTAFLLQAATVGWHIQVLIMSYLILAPQIVVVTWFMRMPLRQRLSVFLGYSLIGSILALLLAATGTKGILGFANVLSSLIYPIGLFVICPLAGLYFLLARGMRPFLALLAASLLYIGAAAVVFYSIMSDPAREIPAAASERPWLILVGLANVVLGVILGGKLLRLLPRYWRLFKLATLILAVVAFFWSSMPLQGARSVLAILSTTAGSVLGVLFVWAVFKVFIWLQEQVRWLTPEIIQAHFCWAYLTLFLLVCVFYLKGSLFRDSGLLFFGCVVAFALQLAVLHTQFWRTRSQRPSRTPKRLLLLRTFGRADEPEYLLDALDDTWRRIGAVDLLARSDVASRTLRSGMLEAFLLRHTADQFLKTDEDVDKRLLDLRSEVEGDARYPVNGVYCYDSVWKQACIRLIQDAAVVLMDLRGFTSESEGCAWELDYLVKHTPLRRILLLVDGATEIPALTKAAQEAWAHLPLASPNANSQRPEIKFLIYDSRREADGHRLFSLLLEAA
jgi:hypothetical protein